MTALKPYPAYRNSGIPWIGEIPSHWETKRNKYLFREINERSESGSEQLLRVSQYTGVTPRVGLGPNEEPDTRAASLEGYKLVEPEDLVVNPMLAWNGSLGFSQYTGIVSPAYCVYRALGRVEPRYFHYFLRSPAYLANMKVESTGVIESRLRLYSDDLFALSSLIPPPDEQGVITDFLDGMDARITRFIAARRKMIALLEEQKQAVINQVVTQGLDPNVPMKDSSVDWLGEIPAHWEMRRFKQYVGFQEGPGIMASDFRDYGIPLLRISCLRDSSATLDGCNFLDPNMVQRKWNHFRVDASDYLISASGNTGAITRANDIVAGAIPYTGIIRLWALSNSVDMDFVRSFIQSNLFSRQVILAKSGVAFEHYGPSHLRRMWLLVPPWSEQQSIIQHIDHEIARSNTLISRHHREIELMQEYRTRLISDVVTGKLDVRGVKLPPVEAVVGEEINAAMEDGEIVVPLEEMVEQ